MVELDIPDVLIERVREVYRREDYRSVSAFVADAIRLRLAELERPRMPGDRGRDELLARARQIVPQTDERKDFRTGEPFTADHQLETRFIAMVIDIHGVTPQNRAHRWAEPDFLRPPEDRDRTMAEWTRLQYKANKVTKGDVKRWNLPPEWIAGDGGNSSSNLDDFSG